ncbi:short chain dehydrogenase [Mycobacterium intermedium]|uniref:Short chain dehydrogenase n=1 Tax=Mycobacterium intermedium TaxID=28445 RepID=A0A1E3SA85_MYCIE|nr:SDR family oxidoreductase [Mycobacterium intermedium]MCV6967564.1 SDR family oxidoreductase [Mycobacterium intermedium]ODQ99049.1 short chain dehydrogenase [Mycobacterium intermedium]OPE52776.1 short chain dehydrogenase [Mycobacterium intermedium]ORB04135.1 short chain dehydrogenase [Mycobacterium intermedium]
MPTALITGASGGIGSAIATALAPTHTLLLAGRPSARLDAVADRLGATTFPLDLTDTESIEASCEVVDALDVLVHNAGVSLPGTVSESTVDQWRATFAVNVIGAVALTQALLPALRQAHGRVVFINSGSGRKASRINASYSASKFALRAVADSLRADEPDIQVTTIYPGRTDTDMQHDLVAYEGGEYDVAKYLRPETVAEAVAYAVAAPADAHVHEVVIRPAAEARG